MAAERAEALRQPNLLLHPLGGQIPPGEEVLQIQIFHPFSQPPGLMGLPQPRPTKAWPARPALGASRGSSGAGLAAEAPPIPFAPFAETPGQAHPSQARDGLLGASPPSLPRGGRARDSPIPGESARPGDRPGGQGRLADLGRVPFLLRKPIRTGPESALGKGNLAEKGRSSGLSPAGKGDRRPRPPGWAPRLCSGLRIFHPKGPGKRGSLSSGP